jgi:hypothetical protein
MAGDVALVGILVLLFCLAAGLLFGIALGLLGILSKLSKE